MRTLILIASMLLISCKNDSKKIAQQVAEIKDSILVLDQGKFYSCCQVDGLQFILTLPVHTVLKEEFSQASGTFYKRKYSIGDSVDLTFIFETTPIYQYEKMSSIIYGCSNHDHCETIEIEQKEQYRSSKTLCLSGGEDCFQFVRFDDIGYCYLILRDKRNLSKEKKESFFNKLYDSIRVYRGLIDESDFFIILFQLIEQ